MNKLNKAKLFGLGVFFMAFVFLAVYGIQIPTEAPKGIMSSEDYAEMVDYVGISTVIIEREGIELLHETSGNLITFAGKDFIEEQMVNLSKRDGLVPRHIALGNSSQTQTEDDEDLAGKLTCCNLSIWNATAIYTSLGEGNYSLVAMWVVTSPTTSVQAAGIFTNQTNFTAINDPDSTISGGHYNTFFAENTFTSTNLEADDTITVIWNISFT